MSELSVPVSIELEKHVIGAMLLDEREISVVRAILAPSDFYAEQHVVLVEAIFEMDAAGKVPDIIALIEHLSKTAGKLADAGGDGYILQISAEVVSAANLKQHSGELLDYSIRRQGMNLSRNVMAAVMDRNQPLDVVVGKVEAAVASFGAKQAQDGPTHIRRSMAATFKNIEATATGKLLGLSTGYRSIDLRTGGLQGSKGYVIAGVPGSGKTLLGINIARNVATRGEGVGVISIEMGKTDLTTRILVAEAGVDSGLLQTGRLPQRDYPKLANASGIVSALPIYIDDRSRQTPGSIRSTIRRLIAEHDIKLFMVDYFQLMTCDRKFKGRYEEMTYACVDMTMVIKDLGLPCIIAVQLDKESAKGGVPTMGNLKETGQIAQDATGICILHRPNQFQKKIKQDNDDIFDNLGKTGEVAPADDANLTFALWEKMRGGTGTGMDKLKFNGPHQKFEEWV